MSNSTFDTVNLEKEYYTLKQKYEKLEKDSQKEIRSLKNQIATNESLSKYLKERIFQFKIAKDKADFLRKEHGNKSENYGNSKESHYYYTPTIVADAHMELNKLSIDICDKTHTLFFKNSK